jgi:probable O-glycosylation ligase (exosortase A-associated)
MLRTLLILILIAIGSYYALQGPFFGLLFYISNAYFRPEEWVWQADFVRSLNLSLLIGVYVTLVSMFSKERFLWNGRIALIAVFLLHTFLSLLFAENFAYCWDYWVNFLKTIVIAYLFVVLITDFRRLRLVLLVMVLALGLEQAKQGWFYLMTSPEWHNANKIPFFGDNNGVALGMLMLVPLIGFLAQTTQNKWTRFFYWILIIGVSNRALSTQSRGALLAFLALGGAAILRSQQRGRLLLGCLVALAILLPTLPDTFWERVSTIRTYEEDQDKSVLGRLHFWTVALEMGKVSPFLGVGFGGYNASYDAYDSSQGEFGTNRSVHSSFLGVLAELGYVGAILYGLIYMSALRACGRIRKRGAKDAMLSEVGKVAAALELSLVAFLVGGCFIPLQYNEMLWHVFALTIVIERLAAQQSEGAKIITPQETPRERLSAA